MKRVTFLTGTRADFGKLKPLIEILENHQDFEVHVIATGMHMQREYGFTFLEIEKCGFENIHTFENHTHETTMDLTVARSIDGLSVFIKNIEPDLIVVHGDRIETLAGAIVGSLNNILVAHIEGGEISGTVDEIIRHSVTKLSHAHFVSNKAAANRLIQLGEIEASIFVIGSPDIDVMFSDKLPSLETVKSYYDINFEKYAIAIFHPITTEIDQIKFYAADFVSALLDDRHNYVVVFPNNDLGSSAIMNEYERLRNNLRFRIIPSLRFEYFLTLLKNAKFLIGNSSSGIHEAPYYGTPVINIGSRQSNRTNNEEIINCGYSRREIFEAIGRLHNKRIPACKSDFGRGQSADLFLKALKDEEFWQINHQKQFRDIQ